MENINRLNQEDPKREETSAEAVNRIMSKPQESKDALIKRIEDTSDHSALIDGFNKGKISDQELVRIVVKKDSQEFKDKVLEEIDLSIQFYLEDNPEEIDDYSVPSLGIKHEDVADDIESNMGKTVESLRNLREKLQKIII